MIPGFTPRLAPGCSRGKHRACIPAPSQAAPQTSPFPFHTNKHGGISPAPTQNQGASRSTEAPEQRGARGRLSPLLTPRVRPGVYHGNTGTVMPLRLPPQPQHPHHPQRACGDRGAQPRRALLRSLLPVSASSRGASAVTQLRGASCGVPVCHPCVLPECRAAVPIPGHSHGVATHRGTPHPPGSSPGGRLRFHKQSRPLVINRFKGMSGWRQLCSPGRRLAGEGGPTETPQSCSFPWLSSFPLLGFGFGLKPHFLNPAAPGWSLISSHP